MEKIELKGYAKINLGLDVIRRLDNGYHQLKMIMQTVSLHDNIIIEKTHSCGIDVYTNKTELPGDENNLVYKAAKYIIDKYNIREGVKINLEKNIPIAAGLAGGSTDAAAVFRGMNGIFNLNLTSEQLRDDAVKLGADIPFCIMGGTYLSEGIGDKLTKLPDMPKCFVLLAKPDIEVSTKWVYENLHANEITRHPDIDSILAGINANNITQICKNLENVLEKVTVLKYPVINEIKLFMNENGALASLMSGSGPTVFGIFEDEGKMSQCAGKLADTFLIKDIFETSCINANII